MVYDVKELKEYFDKRFNELKTHWTLITTHLITLKVRLNQICKNQKMKQIKKIKALESGKKLLQQQVTPLAQQNKETQQRYDELEQQGHRLCLRIDSVPKQNNEKV